MKRDLMPYALEKRDFKYGRDFAILDPECTGEVEAEVDGHVDQPDPSVGCFTAGVDGLSIDTRGGTDLVGMLTRECLERIADALIRWKGERAEDAHWAGVDFRIKEAKEEEV